MNLLESPTKKVELNNILKQKTDSIRQNPLSPMISKEDDIEDSQASE